MAWTIASLYIATMIGAGFASGQEIIQFFTRFGATGLIGVFLCFMLLSVLGGLLIKRCQDKGFHSYRDLLNETTAAASPFFDVLYTFFILLALAIMLAGTDTLFEIAVGREIGRYFTAVLVAIPMFYGTNRILKITEKLVTIMICLIIYVSIATIKMRGITIPSGFHPMGIWYSVLYVGYNLGFTMAVFAGISQMLPDNRQSMRGGVIGGIILGTLITLITLAIFSASHSLQAEAIPMLTLAKDLGRIPGLFYMIAIWIAMYNSALAHTVAVTTRITKANQKHPWIRSMIVIIIGLAIARIGFVSLIQVAYPIFGVVSLYLIYRLLHL